MATIFIIHGTEGYPEENWFPWLKKELEKLGHKVFVPQFPTPEGQTLENWLKVMENYKEQINKDTILVGHSIGCAFIINFLEKINKQIKAAFLVAGFLKKLNKPEYIELNKTFVNKTFDWDKIKQNCKEFYVFNSDNDPNVPLEKGQELAQKLDTDLILIKNAGHFNKAAGYLKFEELLSEIKEIL